MIYLDELLAEKVAIVSAELLPMLQGINPNVTGIYFQHGHPQAIIEELKKLSEDKVTKKMQFPLVALFRDFNEDKGKEVGIYSEATVTMIIATRTEPTYNPEKRKAISFKPILHPIWEALEKQIMWDYRFNTSGLGLDYTQIDRYFWGRESIYGNDSNVFNDFIDCVEIRNLNLKIKQPNC